LTCAWLINTLGPSNVTFNVFAVFNGVAVCPFVKEPETTSAPSTWYNKMFVKSGFANRPLMSVPKAVASALKAASSGAKTVNVPAGFCKATSNPSWIKAASNNV